MPMYHDVHCLPIFNQSPFVFFGVILALLSVKCHGKLVRQIKEGEKNKLVAKHDGHALFLAL